MFSITDHYGDAGETPTRCPFAPIGVLLSKIAEKDVCPAGTADRVGPGDRRWERGTGRPTNHWETKLPLDPANPLLGTSPREPKAGCQRGVRPTHVVALSTEVQRRERRRVHRGMTDTHPRPTHSGLSSGLRKEAKSDPRSCTDPPQRLVLSVRREGQTPYEPLPGPRGVGSRRQEVEEGGEGGQRLAGSLVSWEEEEVLEMVAARSRDHACSRELHASERRGGECYVLCVLPELNILRTSVSSELPFTENQKGESNRKRTCVCSLLRGPQEGRTADQRG